MEDKYAFTVEDVLEKKRPNKIIRCLEEVKKLASATTEAGLCDATLGLADWRACVADIDTCAAVAQSAVAFGEQLGAVHAAAADSVADASVRRIARSRAPRRSLSRPATLQPPPPRSRPSLSSPRSSRRFSTMWTTQRC